MPSPPSVRRTPSPPDIAITIRPAASSDLDALLVLYHHVQSLHAQAHPDRFRSQAPANEVTSAFRKMMEDPSAQWLIAETEQPVGYLYAQFQDRPETWLRPASRFCYLSHISIHPDMRRKGVGRRLIAAMVVEAKKRGFTRIVLEVWAFNREARIAFKHLGFTVFNECMELRRPQRLHSL